MRLSGTCCLFGVTLFMGVMIVQTATAKTEDLGNGFLHHGVATSVSNHRGTVATVDGEGRNAVLVWLFDHRGGYALLMVDADKGKSEEFPMPFATGGDCPYASILSTRNKFYTHFGNHFVEFDPVKRAFTFEHETAPQMAMSMTEDDNGVIWSVTYPNSGLVSFNPKTRELKDYGHVHKENWAQYPRYVAADDQGWIYFGIGNTASQIIIFDPATANARAILPQAEQVKGSASLFRDMNGKVYGSNGSDVWYELYRGDAQRIPKPQRTHAKPYISASQSLFHRLFPDGKLLKECDLVTRTLVVEDPQTKESKTLSFEYTSEGAHIMGVAAAPDGTICGGTAFPMRFFSFNPKTDEWINREAYGQWNTVARQGDRFFVGGYGGGFLLEWDPSKPWVTTVPSAGAPQTLGWGYTGSDHYHFNGLIDEVRVYDRALSAEKLGTNSREGLVACWTFDEGDGQVAGDSSSKGNHGAIQGATWVEGKSGKALRFDGVDDYVKVPDSPSLRVEDAVTVEAWILPTPPHQQTYGGIINNIAGSGNNRLLVGDSGGTLAQVRIGSSTQDITGPPVKSNEWNHVVYIYDGSQEYFVVNGVEGTRYPKSGQLSVASNPRFLAQCTPTINRPHDLLLCPDARTVVLAGTPGYGYTGGGLMFWDRQTQQAVVIKDTEIIPEHSTMSLAPLSGGKILGGTTIDAGTGGEGKATEAQLYIMDVSTKKLVWHEAVFPGVKRYTDLCEGPRGRVYGIADRVKFFVFDPVKRKVIHEEQTEEKFGITTSQQGPRVFVKAPDGKIYLLFIKGIAEVNPETFGITMLAESPISIGPGGDYFDGRIYFGSGSHLYSYTLPAEPR